MPGALHLDQVAVPEEAGDEARTRATEQGARRVALHALSAIDHRDPVAHRQRLLLIVGDVDERGTGLLLDALQLGLHLAPDLLVERAERLVQQQDRRRERERPGKRDPLLLAAAQRHHVAVLGAGEADEREQIRHPLPHLRLRPPAHPEAVAHVLLDVHVREHRVALEDHADVAFPRRHSRDVPAVDHHTSGIRRLQPRNHPQHRGLAGAARTEKCEELSSVHIEGEVAGGDGVAEALVEGVEPEDGFGHRDGGRRGVGTRPRRVARRQRCFQFCASSNDCAAR